jgi:hypothetical protein
MEQAKITILGAVESRNITTQKGPKTVYGQRASLETEAMRISIEIECDGPNMGYAVGSQHVWDVAADLVPGKFGVDLARRKTLRPFVAEAAKPARAA